MFIIYQTCIPQLNLLAPVEEHHPRLSKVSITAVKHHHEQRDVH